MKLESLSGVENGERKIDELAPAEWSKCEVNRSG